MKKILASLMMAGMLFTVPVFAQEFSPSGDTCWTPDETAPVAEEQAFTFVRALTEEEVATVKKNVTAQNPSGTFSFSYIEFWDTALDDSVWVFLYQPNLNTGHEGEVCFQGAFPQTQAQIDEVLRTE